MKKLFFAILVVLAVSVWACTDDTGTQSDASVLEAAVDVVVFDDAEVDVVVGDQAVVVVDAVLENDSLSD